MEEMFMEIESRQLWGRYPILKGFVVKEKSLYVIESGGVWENARLIVCDKDTGREYSHLQKLLHMGEVERELKNIYGVE